jgi:acetyl-CoA carboxylase carboxyltransferase component
MGGPQAAEVLVSVKRDQQTRRGGTLTPDDEAAIREPILRRYDHEGSPYYSTARLWDDGVITATETRTALALGLAVAANVAVPHPKFGIFRM